LIFKQKELIKAHWIKYRKDDTIFIVVEN